jgi:hypothetical protein
VHDTQSLTHSTYVVDVMPHPDKDEAQEWVASEIAEVHAMSYRDLLPIVDNPIHHRVPSRTGRLLMGETQVFDLPGEPDWLQVTVDIFEPQPGNVHAIAEQTFFVAADGSVTDTSPLG